MILDTTDCGISGNWSFWRSASTRTGSGPIAPIQICERPTAPTKSSRRLSRRILWSTRLNNLRFIQPRYTGEERIFRGLCTPRNEFEFALGLLWQSYFLENGWRRLKNCPVCHKWFVDHTSDMRKARCSDPCTNRWWNYDRRKEAGYSRCKNGGYHGTDEPRKHKPTRK
jgi:hypothetical protein